MNVQRVFGGFVATVCLCTACGGGGGNGAPTGPTGTNGSGTTTTTSNQIIASAGNVFSPSSLSVAKGTDVTFTFESVTHNVTFDAVAGRPADVGNTSGASVVRTFSTAGTFGYQCTLHSGMRGTVVVN